MVLDTRCWLLSDSQKRPVNPKTNSMEWGNPEELLTFHEMCEALKNHSKHRPAIIPSYCGLLDLDKVRNAETGEVPTWITTAIRDVGR